MRYLDVLSKHGLRMSVQPSGSLKAEPSEIITDSVRALIRDHKDEIVGEIRGAAGDNNAQPQEIIPTYRFLWVATTLESFEAYDPRYGYELSCGPIYRMLDAPYYAWLRHRMENVVKAHRAGSVTDEEFSVLRERFNTIHTWGVTHIGEGTLKQAVRTTNAKAYIPPSEETYMAYRRTWDEAIKTNTQRQRESRESSRMYDDPVAHFAHLLATRRYAVIESSLVDRPMVYMRDADVAVPSQYASNVHFTINELLLLRGCDHQSLRRICDIKDIFGGTVLSREPATERRPVDRDGQSPGSQLALIS